MISTSQSCEGQIRKHINFLSHSRSFKIFCSSLISQLNFNLIHSLLITRNPLISLFRNVYNFTETLLQWINNYTMFLLITIFSKNPRRVLKTGLVYGNSGGYFQANCMTWSDHLKRSPCAKSYLPDGCLGSTEIVNC